MAYFDEIKAMNLETSNNCPNSNLLGLYCDHEGSKTFFTEAWNILCCDDKYPDIIIHKGDLPEGGVQEIVCEIKRMSKLGSKEMLLDLNKLITISGCEIWKGYGYRIPVFLVSNGTKEQLEKKIKNYRNSKYTVYDLLHGKDNKEITFSEYVTENKERLKNILCLCHSAENVVETTTIYDVAQSKIKR